MPGGRNAGNAMKMRQTGKETEHRVLTSFFCALCRAVCAPALFSTMASSFSALGAQERPGQACREASAELSSSS